MLNTIDTSIIFAYLALMIAVGVYAGRNQDTVEDFFVAGRRVSTFSIGCLLFGLFFAARVKRWSLRVCSALMLYGRGSWYRLWCSPASASFLEGEHAKIRKYLQHAGA